MESLNDFRDSAKPPKNQAFNIPHVNSPALCLKTRIKSYVWDYPKNSQPLFSLKARNQ